MLNTKYTEYTHKRYLYEFSYNGIIYVVEKNSGPFTGERFSLTKGISINSPRVYKQSENENLAKELFEMFSDPNITDEGLELWLELNMNFLMEV